MPATAAITQHSSTGERNGISTAHANNAPKILQMVTPPKGKKNNKITPDNTDKGATPTNI